MRCAAREASSEIVDAAELQQAEAERNVAWQRELADRTRQDVMTLLRGLLAAARRAPGAGPTNNHSLEQPTEAKVLRPDQTGSRRELADS